MKERKKRSLLWTLDEEILRAVVKKSTSLSSIIAHFGFVLSGGNFSALKARLIKSNIDFSHIPLGVGANRNRFLSRKNKIPLEKILVQNSSYSRGHLKRRLVLEGLLEERCAWCPVQTTWNGKPLVLVLDHINGIRDDNRIENLRFLCPNCNSQTSTFSGRHNKKRKYLCTRCGKQKSKKSDHCQKCFSFLQQRCAHPDKEQLAKEVWEVPLNQVAQKYGVKGTTIRSWCEICGIKRPTKGYWQKRLYSKKSFGPLV